jgi:ABC-type nitrate/sulfonate/bicarbonate transport system permease component
MSFHTDPIPWEEHQRWFAERLAAMREFLRPEMPATSLVELLPLIDSSDMAPGDWDRIALAIEASYWRYDGFVVVMGTLWSVIIATDNGVRNVPPIYARAARTMGSSGLHTWLWVIFPAALPFIVGGMKQGWAFAWRSLMAAEIYVTILSGFGLGHLLHYGRELNAMEQVIGIMLVLLLIGLLADKIFFSPWERFLHRRWGTAK